MNCNIIAFVLSVVIVTVLLFFLLIRRRERKPFIFQVLTPSEVESLLAEVDQSVDFKRSMVVGDTEDQESTVRTSSSGWLPYASPESRKLRALAADMCGVPESHCETSLHVAKYVETQQYREHQDACCDAGAACQRFRQGAGNRIGTLLVYLTDDFEEGGTAFPNLGTNIKPKAGEAIGWCYKGCPNWALHSGTPVKSGTKIIATVWVRERRTQ